MSTFSSFDFEVVLRQFREINRRKHCRSFIRFRLSQQKGVDNKYVWNWYSSHNCSHLIPKIALDIQLKDNFSLYYAATAFQCNFSNFKSYYSVNCLLFITAMLHKNKRYHRFFTVRFAGRPRASGPGSRSGWCCCCGGGPCCCSGGRRCSTPGCPDPYHHHHHHHHHDHGHHHDHLVALVEEVGGAGLAVAGLVLDTWVDVIN